MSTALLLWTGGWDSTFRLCELALVEKRPVLPIYLLTGRNSERNELGTMADLWRRIGERCDDPTLLHQTVIYQDIAGTPEYDLVGPRWARVKAPRPTLGDQYLKLAVLAERMDWWNVEVSWARGEVSEELVQDVFVDPDVPPSRLEVTDTNEGWLFRRFSFPLLDRTKADFRAQAEQAGFLDILQATWFCNNPLGGKACGVCLICSLARQAGEPFETAPRPLAVGRQFAYAARNPVERVRRYSQTKARRS